jgi:hypothetical protein
LGGCLGNSLGAGMPNAAPARNRPRVRGLHRKPGLTACSIVVT